MTKSGFQKRFERTLGWLARRIIRKYRPDVIAVTGSYGKTTTKEAIFTVLASHFSVRQSQGNLNNEIGLPLSIIGAASGGRNPIAWLTVFNKAFRLLVKTRPYPECLVLEMAADRPGDLAYLTSIAKPRVSVTTAVAPAHTEFFGSIEKVAEEKATLSRQTEPDGYSILKADDPVVLGFKQNANGRVLTYGRAKDAEVKASNPTILFEAAANEDRPRRVTGLRFDLSFDGKTVEVKLDNVVGTSAVNAALAAAAVGFVYGQDHQAIASALKHFRPPAGRSSILDGAKGSVIIDDSYNASPGAVIESLNLLNELQKGLAKNKAGGRRIAVLGDMAELGSYTEKGHADVGAACVKTVDILVTVGPLGRRIAAAAEKHGLNGQSIHIFEDADSAAIFVRRELEPGDVVLVKGSQVVRLEKVVRQIMADPELAAERLVRQGTGWQ